jgi:hypothetical protein
MSANVISYSDYVRESIEAIHVKRQGLSPGGPLFEALSEERIRAVLETLTSLPDEGLDGGAWCPSIFGLARSWSAPELRDFDFDLAQVLAHTTDHKNSQQFRALVSGEQPWRSWYGPLFEISIKGRLLRKGSDIAFDVLLPNGRDVDRPS